MRIGIDAHILSPEHHKHHPEIAEYTRRLVGALLKRDTKHTYVLFMDARMPAEELAAYKRPNTEIKHFPFSAYRAYLPFVYSHMLVSSLLAGARLDVFHSPEGLIPYLYPGKIVATFHWVPTGNRDSNVFVKTWMLGARTGFAAFCWRADRIIVRVGKDRDILCGVHRYPEDRAVVIAGQDLQTADWDQQAADMLAIYEDIVRPKPKTAGKRLLPRVPRLWRSRKKA